MVKYHKARKPYDCCTYCGGTIKKGHDYCNHGNGQRECHQCIGEDCNFIDKWKKENAA